MVNIFTVYMQCHIKYAGLFKGVVAADRHTITAIQGTFPQ